MDMFCKPRLACRPVRRPARLALICPLHEPMPETWICLLSLYWHAGHPAHLPFLPTCCLTGSTHPCASLALLVMLWASSPRTALREEPIQAPVERMTPMFGAACEGHGRTTLRRMRHSGAQMPRWRVSSFANCSLWDASRAWCPLTMSTRSGPCPGEGTPAVPPDMLPACPAQQTDFLDVEAYIVFDGNGEAV